MHFSHDARSESRPRLYPRRQPFLIACSLSLLSFLNPASGDEALLRDGTRSGGALSFLDGKFSFTPTRSGGSISWNRIDRVEPTRKQSSALIPPFWWQATLINGDKFACNLAEIESNAVILDSAWFQGLRVRRSMIRAIERPLGWTPWLRQDLIRDVRGWKEIRDTGESATPVGMTGLTLGGSNKLLQFTPEAPLSCGLIVLLLKNASPNDAGRWQLRLAIDRDGALQPLVIQFGARGAKLQAEGLEVHDRSARIEGESFLLEIELGQKYVATSVNRHLIGWSERGLPNARLRALSLETADGQAAEKSGRLIVQEFAVGRRLETLARPPAHPEIDEAWLESGDQVFGEFRAISSQNLQLMAGRTPRRILCSQIRGLYPRKENAPGLVLSVPWQFKLTDPSGAEPSVLSGTVRSWDEKTCKLSHPILGDLTLPRDQVQSVAQIAAGASDTNRGASKEIKP